MITTYTWSQFIPAFSLVGVASVLLLADAFLPKLPKRLFGAVAAAATFVTGCFLMGGEHANAFGLLACLATCFSILLALDYTQVTCASLTGSDSEEGSTELYALPMVACAGILALTQAKDLITLFVSLEVITLTSYVLAGYFRRNQGSVEAGIKYLVIGAMSTGMLVFGAAWYFGMSGTFELGNSAVVAALNGSPVMFKGFLMAIALLLTGAFFKVGAAPMQVWVPDVYQGAPTPVSNFLATASKTAGFVLLSAVVAPMLTCMGDAYLLTLGTVTVATLVIGNLGALTQSNAKRLLGYSSIGQAGFILVFYLPLNSSPLKMVAIQSNVLLYLAAYTLATTVAFFAIAMVRTQRGSEELSAFRGLGTTNPRLAFLITVAFASLAGVPLTAGFLVKMLSFIALISVMGKCCCLVWVLLPVMIICAAAGFYYYFKVIREMYWVKPAEGDKPLSVPVISGLVMTICTLLIIITGTGMLLIKTPFM